MSLYDDIEPTVKRQKKLYRNVSESSTKDIEVPTHSNKDKGFAAVSMFAPRTVMTKATKPPSRTNAPSTLQTVYSDPGEPTPSSSSSFPTAPAVQQQQQPPCDFIDFEGILSYFKQRKMEMDKVLDKKSLPTLKAHQVDVTKIQALPAIPQGVQEDSEFLFDEVDVLDEYMPSKPNSYSEFMKSLNCNPQFGEEIDDSELEKFIQDEIINGNAEKERSSSSPEPEKESVSGTDVGANIMAKMGYTFGSGLGKHGQGMTSALRVEKKGGQAGKIIHETDEAMREVGLNPEAFQGCITNILLLRNVYKLDGIPENYDNELRRELSRYGAIKKLILRRDPNAEDFFDEVRIFVEYLNKSAAIKAFGGLNSGYLNGRSIRANFYPIDRFMLGHYCDASY